MGLHDLPTPSEAVQTYRANQKPIPHQLAKAEKKKTKAQAEKEFRAAVWERDKGRSRASRKPLGKSGTDYERVGEVHHMLKRSTAPEHRLDPGNGVLLSKAEHLMAETACPGDPQFCLLDICFPTVEWDCAKPLTFIWREASGKELRRRIG